MRASPPDNQPLTSRRPSRVALPRLANTRPVRYERVIPDLRPGEKVVMLRREHRAALMRKLGWPFLLLFAWLISLIWVLPFIASLQPGPLDPPAEGLRAWLPALLWLAWMALAAGLVLWASYIVLDWSDDWIAVTNQRVIIMDKALFFRETRREVPIGKVQNAVAEYHNSLGMALDFGDIKIDTAGLGVLSFRNLPGPRTMREAIFAQQTAARASQPSAEERRRAAVLGIMRGEVPPPSTPAGTVPSAASSKPSTPAPAGVRSLLAAAFPFSPERGQSSITWHKHWVFLVRGLFWPVLVWWLVALACFLSVAFGSSVEGGQPGPLTAALGWALVLLAPVCLLWAAWNWEDWRNDLYRLDRERVYDIEALPFGLREQSKETLITRVTDVTYVVPGPLAHLLDYGNVVIKTPGEATEFSFTGVPCPREVQREIIDRVEEYRQKASASADKEIEAWLKTYHDVQQGAGGGGI